MANAPQRVKAIATMPESRYHVNGRWPEIHAYGEGGSLAIATTRAVRALFKSPGLKHKTPNWLYIQTAGFDMYDLPPLWHQFGVDRKPVQATSHK